MRKVIIYILLVAVLLCRRIIAGCLGGITLFCGLGSRRLARLAADLPLLWLVCVVTCFRRFALHSLGSKLKYNGMDHKTHALPTALLRS